MKSKVSIVRCNSHDEKEVYSAVKKIFKDLGGVNRFVKKGQTVLLKPNFLMKSARTRHATTDPSMIYAVGKVLKDAGVKILLGDSPAVNSTVQVAESNGSDKVCKRLGIKMVEFKEVNEVKVPKWKRQPRFYLPKVLEKVDAVINLPRMKTHGLCIFTGAVKNLYGLNSGITKGRYHVKFFSKEEFGEMLADLLSVARPTLNIMDGIVAMEGNGPGNGDPKDVGCIIGSVDPVALDGTACRVVGIPADKIDYLIASEKRGLGSWKRRI